MIKVSVGNVSESFSKIDQFLPLMFFCLAPWKSGYTYKRSRLAAFNHPMKTERCCPGLGCDQTCQKISRSKGVGSLPNQFMLLSKPDQWCLVSQDHMALTFKCPPKWGESERESNFILCYLFLPNILTLIFSQRGVLRLDEYHSINTVCDKFVFSPPSSLFERMFQFVFHF